MPEPYEIYQHVPVFLAKFDTKLPWFIDPSKVEGVTESSGTYSISGVDIAVREASGWRYYFEDGTLDTTIVPDAPLSGGEGAGASQNQDTNEAFSNLIAETLPTGNINPWTPATAISSDVAGYSLTTTAIANLGGITAPAFDWVGILYVTGTDRIRLDHNDGSVAAANQFNLVNASNLQVQPGGSVWIRYSTTDAKWTVIGVPN